jgi:PKD repeat protein
MKKKSKTTKIKAFLIISLLVIILLYPIGYANQQINHDIIQQIKQTPNKTLFADKIIGDVHVNFWIHKINNIEIKNDYILYQINKNNNEIIKYEKHWRDIEPIQNDISALEFNNLDIAWKKLVIFPEEHDLNNFYSIYNKQNFPLLCWEVRYNNGITSLININGEKIGEGVPAPSEYKGFSLSGFCEVNSPDCWISWRHNANLWFKKWCISTTSISLPSPDTISSYVSNPEYSLFYELAHGASTYFQANSPGVYYYSSDVEEDMLEREKNVFSFIGSCEGMTDTGEGTFSYEFRKGSLNETVTIGYTGMGTCPGWSVSIQWQNFMFYAMDSNYTINEAFNLACAEYQTIADCVVFVGDPNLKIIEYEEDDDDDNSTIPDILITYPKEKSIVNGNITITGIADDLDGAINKIYVQIDNGDWQEASGTSNWELFWDTTTVLDGLHKITAIAVDNNGAQSGCYYRNVYVVNDILQTNIISVNHSLINQEIIFQSSTTGGIPPYNYTWDFDDGTISYNPNAIHMYNSQGRYNIKLTVKDSINSTDTVTKYILITENDTISPVIEIIKPEKALYIVNKKILPLPFILILGDITLEIHISDLGGSGLNKVEFYIDDSLKEIFSNPIAFNVKWTWDTIAFLKHKITIKVYDNAGNSDIQDFDVFKFG